MKQVFVDVETTGLDPQTCHITELGIIYRKNGKIVKRVCYKNNIRQNAEKFLSSIIDPYNAKDKAYFLAYNAKFDADFMRELFKGGNLNFGNFFYNMPVDIMQLAAYKFMQKGIVPENFKLSTVARTVGIKVIEDKLHGAAYDIDIAKQLFNKLKTL